MSSRFYSSLTKKYVMSLAGLFLFSFLFVHLSINLLILFDDSKVLFNEAAHFMGTNPFIQTFQWVLFGGFAIHMIFGVILQIQNWISRPKRYNKKAASEENYLSKFMIHTSILLAVVIVALILKNKSPFSIFKQCGSNSGWCFGWTSAKNRYQHRIRFNYQKPSQKATPLKIRIDVSSSYAGNGF